MSEPVAVVVKVVVNEARLEEFMQVMKADVEGARAEEGCLRFDFLKVDATTFIFYEVYRDAASIDVHRATPHYLSYAAFKDSGGLLSRDATVAAALDFQSP
mmetsp:Transcript_30228/g.92470  ORF Transcript_30228/g.92470 Transcript_30228/m.92470 type:complete len:101 (+) Transcript_30228:64-366(+)|eukprot:CAMPEP_0198644898 /NCGR_PEP_ID=MMETSP1467-20131203/920_1 /TAXON_ID=1462469 /ORGANISM="unid. sp., Strain CCMP2135" /LENGTH=100 /DNA_ID=CAMNT_0044380367 /DNA_START=39 /DNA_END=341 /DNA_ORIENTATION=+